ncbi:MAG TPA: cytidine deaminase [Clostridia bacterium]|jgi:cytidine deaminase|nr:MAG: Cytidine deaminase [Firmicutes bacterium ADurb.Bin248]HOG00798.1 cytidine deaminase [Clostridia bacterium]HOS19229.1 cytidine deaminase [Clostridia bacterium]HPK15700.1 cytidine deaminase [Clostridia bacterium]
MRNIHDFEVKNMLRMANDARDRAYVPYSGFRVGACLKGSTGAYYLGCNIENAAYSPTVCAERNAMFKAVYEGEREFDAIAIVWDGENVAVPCGVCRQVLAEFCDPEMPVICANRKGEYKVLGLGDLLPLAFTPADLSRK